MTTPMAVRGMEPMEVEEKEVSDPKTWTWRPKVENWGRLVESVRLSNQTSRMTNSKQTDYGEGK